MRKYFCNRCGKEIKDIYHVIIYGEACHFGAFSFEQAARNIKANNQLSFGCEKEYCLECIEEFDRFMEDKREI